MLLRRCHGGAFCCGGRCRRRAGWPGSGKVLTGLLAVMLTLLASSDFGRDITRHMVNTVFVDSSGSPAAAAEDVTAAHNPSSRHVVNAVVDSSGSPAAAEDAHNPSRAQPQLAPRGRNITHNSSCKVGLERWVRLPEGPFTPGTLDIVITWYNESHRLSHFGRSSPDDDTEHAAGARRCHVWEPGPGCLGTKTPCCKDYSAENGTCGSGPTFCECADCLDYRVVNPSNYGGELRWLLRGIDTHLGIFDAETAPAGLIRRVYIVYNELYNSNPPSFVDWEDDMDASRQPPSGCAAKSWVSGGGTLVALPHCVTFLPGTKPPGRNREASQSSILHIPGLADHYLYLEDDFVPVKPIAREKWFQQARGLIFTHLNGKMPHEFRDGDRWHNAQYQSVQLLEARFGPKQRLVDAAHTPLLLDRCLMEEMALIWDAEVRYTATEGNIRTYTNEDPHGKGCTTILAMGPNYMIDRGGALNQITGDNDVLELHTNDERFDLHAVMTQLCGDFSASFLQLQGPGWSDEYMGGAYLPRGDIRSAFNGLLHTLLPSKSRWENAANAAAHAIDSPGNQSICAN